VRSKICSASVSEAVTHEPRQQQRPKPTRRVIEIDEVLSMVPLSKASVYRMQKAGTFPKSRAIGANRSAWFVDDIESWLEALPHGRRRSRGKSQP
jgi:prophage regulatory protein